MSRFLLRVFQLERRVLSRCLCTSTTVPPPRSPDTNENVTIITEENETSTSKLGGFAKAFQKQMNEVDSMFAPAVPQKYTFASLLRNSKFIDLGDPKGKIVVGEIIDIIESDMYIDFGWKFTCVCMKPKKNPEDYVIGTKVRLMINDLELSSRFLGSDSDLTLLEADCKLLNIVYSPVKK